MKLDNWPIEVQLGSTNSKGLPVLFQGPHQSFLPNDHYSSHCNMSHGHARGSCWSHAIRCRVQAVSNSPSLVSCRVVLSHPSRPSIQHHATNQPGRILHQRVTMSSLETPSADCSRVASLSPDSHGHSSTLPHKQHRQACTSVELPSCQHGCNHDGRWKPRSVLRMASIQPVLTRGRHPLWHALLAQQTCAMQRRLAARKIRSWSQSDQRRNVLRTDGWTDRPRGNPTKQHEKRKPHLNSSSNITKASFRPSNSSRRRQTL